MTVVVVGAGVVGLATAYRLARDGVHVTVVDAGEPGQQASTHNAGWVVPILSTPVPAPGMVGTALRWAVRRDSPLYIRPLPVPGHVSFLLRMLRHCNSRDHAAGTEALAELNAATLDLFAGYRADGIDVEWHERGLLMAFLDEDEMRHHARDFEPLARIGHTTTVLGRDEAHDVEPALGPGVRGVIQCPQERHLRTSTLVDGLLRRCRELGVTVLGGHRVTGVRRDRNGRVDAVVAGEEEIAADAFVLAGGVWTGELARMLGVRLPIRPGKGYGHDFAPAPTAASHALYLAEARVAMAPLDGGLRLAGTMEFGRIEDTVDPVRAAAIRTAAADYLGDWDATAEPTHTWSGMRPMTPDGLPCIGWLRPYDNVLVAAGHAMLGITLAPATAEAVAALLHDTADDTLLAPFTPSRFTRR